MSNRALARRTQSIAPAARKAQRLILDPDATARLTELPVPPLDDKSARQVPVVREHVLAAMRRYDQLAHGGTENLARHAEEAAELLEKIEKFMDAVVLRLSGSTEAKVGAFHESWSGVLRFVRAERSQLVRWQRAIQARADPHLAPQPLVPPQVEAVTALLVPPMPPVGVFDWDQEKAYRAALFDVMEKRIRKLAEGIEGRSQARRDDPEGSVHPWTSIAKLSELAAGATNSIFGSYRTGEALVPNVHLFDRWEEITKAVSAMSEGEKRDEAQKVAKKYIRASPEVNDLNARIRVDASNDDHMTKLIEPVATQLADVPVLQQLLLDMHMNQPGSCNPFETRIMIQRCRIGQSTVSFAWKTFVTLVHEYIHSLADEKYHRWAINLGGEKKHTLTEGMTDALTRIVIANLSGPGLALMKRADGEPVHRGTYAEAADRAEEIMKTAGTANVYEAYFLGKIELLGGAG